MKYIFFLVLTTLALFSCNTQEKAKKLSLFCYVRYDEAIKEVKAEASLQDAINKTSVEMPGGIEYQGMEMTLAPVYGMTYHIDYTSAFLVSHDFEWKGKKNEKQRFRMTIDPITSFSLDKAAISQKKLTALQWVGKPLEKGETMVLMWENKKNGLTVPMEVTTSSNQSLIDIPAAKLKDIIPGDWTLSLVRKKLVKKNVDDMPVNGIMEYYTKKIPVKVTP